MNTFDIQCILENYYTSLLLEGWILSFVTNLGLDSMHLHDIMGSDILKINILSINYHATTILILIIREPKRCRGHLITFHSLFVQQSEGTACKEKYTYIIISTLLCIRMNIKGKI